MSTTDFRGSASAIPTNTTAIYADGDLIGGKLTLTGLVPFSGGRAMISGLTITDLSEQNAALTVLFFNSNPTGTTFTDNAELDVADADLINLAGFIPVAATDYVGLKDNSVASVNKYLTLAPNGTSVVYAAIVSEGTPTYAGTTDLKLVVGTL